MDNLGASSEDELEEGKDTGLPDDLDSEFGKYLKWTSRLNL